ncbi:MAG: thioredoxin [Prevotella sp.]|nr:thioredoxin [Prevotella sp.]
MKRLFLISIAMTVAGLTSCSGNSQQAKSVVKKQVLTQQNAKKMNVQELTAETFKQKVMNYDIHPNEWIFEGSRPAIIDFYATWCGPCKQTAPIVEKLAEDYAGRIDVYKVDVDQQQELAAFFGVQSIPTILFIPKEGTPQRVSGAMPRSGFDEAIKQVFKME